MNYKMKLRRGNARASMVMDHGRTGPKGALGGSDGGMNRVLVRQNGKDYTPPHLSKDQDIMIGPGDTIRVSTPGGGGYGNPFERDVALVERDVIRGYYTSRQAEELFGVVFQPDGKSVDPAATDARRRN